MIVDLTGISGSESYDLVFPANEVAIDTPGANLVGEVRLSCKIVRHIVATDVSGHIEASVELDCTRCLEPVNETLSIDFAVDFVDEDGFVSDREVELTSKDLATDLFDGESVDLKDIAREQIVLMLPQQVVCSDECKGLCAKCGANRNLTSCGCSDAEPDPRWAALKNLK